MAQGCPRDRAGAAQSGYGGSGPPHLFDSAEPDVLNWRAHSR